MSKYFEERQTHGDLSTIDQLLDYLDKSIFQQYIKNKKSLQETKKYNNQLKEELYHYLPNDYLDNKSLVILDNLTPKLIAKLQHIYQTEQKYFYRVVKYMITYEYFLLNDELWMYINSKVNQLLSDQKFQMDIEYNSSLIRSYILRYNKINSKQSNNRQLVMETQNILFNLIEYYLRLFLKNNKPDIPFKILQNLIKYKIGQQYLQGLINNIEESISLTNNQTALALIYIRIKDQRDMGQFNSVAQKCLTRLLDYAISLNIELQAISIIFSTFQKGVKIDQLQFQTFFKALQYIVQNQPNLLTLQQLLVYIVCLQYSQYLNQSIIDFFAQQISRLTIQINSTGDTDDKIYFDIYNILLDWSTQFEVDPHIINSVIDKIKQIRLNSNYISERTFKKLIKSFQYLDQYQSQIKQQNINYVLNLIELEISKPEYNQILQIKDILYILSQNQQTLAFDFLVKILQKIQELTLQKDFLEINQLIQLCSNIQLINSQEYTEPQKESLNLSGLFVCLVEQYIELAQKNSKFYEDIINYIPILCNGSDKKTLYNLLSDKFSYNLDDLGLDSNIKILNQFVQKECVSIPVINSFIQKIRTSHINSLTMLQIKDIVVTLSIASYFPYEFLSDLQQIVQKIIQQSHYKQVEEQEFALNFGIVFGYFCKIEIADTNILNYYEQYLVENCQNIHQIKILLIVLNGMTMYLSSNEELWYQLVRFVNYQLVDPQIYDSVLQSATQLKSLQAICSCIQTEIDENYFEKFPEVQYLWSQITDQSINLNELSRQSDLQKQVQNVLQQYKINFKKEVKIGPYRVDFLLDDDKVLEVNGLPHYITDTDKLNWFTLKKYRHIQKLGYHIYTINYKTWQDLISDTLKINYIKNLIT